MEFSRFLYEINSSVKPKVPVFELAFLPAPLYTEGGGVSRWQRDLHFAAWKGGGGGSSFLQTESWIRTFFWRNWLFKARQISAGDNVATKLSQRKICEWDSVTRFSSFFGLEN